MARRNEKKRKREKKRAETGGGNKTDKQNGKKGRNGRSIVNASQLFRADPLVNIEPRASARAHSPSDGISHASFPAFARGNTERSILGRAKLTKRSLRLNLTISIEENIVRDKADVQHVISSDVISKGTATLSNDLRDVRFTENFDDVPVAPALRHASVL